MCVEGSTHVSLPACIPSRRPPAERTAHLKPGTQFIKSFWMTEGFRATNTSVVRWVGGVEGWRRVEWVGAPAFAAGLGALFVGVGAPPPPPSGRNAVHKVNKQPVSIKFYG